MVKSLRDRHELLILFSTTRPQPPGLQRIVDQFIYCTNFLERISVRELRGSLFPSKTCRPPLLHPLLLT
jgi:hypothetical protein